MEELYWRLIGGNYSEEDRISDLPDSIIQHILSFLPSTKEAVSTGVLSKRWRNQWTHIPVLIFKPSSKSGDAYYRFVANTLNLHKCPKIKKFHLHYHEYSDPDPLFTSKIRFAIRKSVEELILILSCRRGPYLLPEFLFDNASLVRLEMVNCYFMPNWRVNWPSLKSLKMDCDSLSNNNICSQGIENILSGSPLLESLEILDGTLGDHVNILSKSLKVLTFYIVHVPGVFNISCPNLVEFNVFPRGWMVSTFPNQMIENVLLSCQLIHSLTLVKCTVFCKLVIGSRSLKALHLEDIETATIEVSCPNVEKLDFICRLGNIFEAVNLPPSICASLDYRHQPYWDRNKLDSNIPVKQLLEQFQHIKELTIERSFFNMIVSDLDIEVCRSLPLLNNKFLTLNIGSEFGFALPGIAYALRSPELEKLVIKFNSLSSWGTLKKDLLDYWNSYGSTDFACLLSHLKTVEIIGLNEGDVNSELVIEFIEFLLKKARVLKKMVVLLQGYGKGFEISQKLLSFPRYSRGAQIELLNMIQSPLGLENVNW